MDGPNTPHWTVSGLSVDQPMSQWFQLSAMHLERLSAAQVIVSWKSLSIFKQLRSVTQGNTRALQQYSFGRRPSASAGLPAAASPQLPSTRTADFGVHFK